METQKQLKSSHLHIKDCLALNSHFGIFQTSSSSKPYILFSRNLMEGFMQHGDSETANHLICISKKCLALYSHFGILQTSSSSKPSILLSRNLIEGFMQHGDSETAKIIPFAYQRLSSTKQPFWNSSTNIFFQTIFPL